MFPSCTRKLLQKSQAGYSTEVKTIKYIAQENGYALQLIELLIKKMSRDAWQMWNIVFVQIICIKDKITTGTKYSIMKKIKYDEFIRENDDYLFNKQLLSFNT